VYVAVHDGHGIRGVMLALIPTLLFFSRLLRAWFVGSPGF
jgi:hypothetical protein